MELSAWLCDDLGGGTGDRKGGDTCIHGADALHCTVETTRYCKEIIF